jgi:hypothetical protein
MSSYLTPYNVAIANQQKGFDVRNLQNDIRESRISPLFGGRQGDFQMEGGDFWSDFADGFMSVMRPVGQVASAVAPFLGAGESGGMRCRCPSRAMGDNRCRCGSGLSGGDEIIDAEPALLNPDLNSTGMFHGISGGYNENISGMGLSGGDFLSDLGNTMSQVAPFLPLLGLGEHSSDDEKTASVARALLGSGFFDDLLSGISKVGETVASIAPHVKTGLDIYDKFKGKGLSGGAKHKMVGRKLLAELKALHGRAKGAGLSGGDFDWSTLASFAPLLLGLGLSGGQEEPDMSYLEPFLSGFGMSGGSFIDDLISGINKAVNKVGDLIDKGVKVGSEGLDKIMPIVEKVGKIADTAGKVASLVSGKKGEGLSGGDMSVNAPFVGFDMATGKDFKRPVGGRARRAKDTRFLSGKQQLYKGGNIPNEGQPPFNVMTNAGMSGGNSAALVAQQMRSNVNQPYTTGRTTGEIAGGKRCCFNVVGSKSGLCNGTKHYRFKLKGKGETANSESIDEIEAVDALNRAQAAANPQVNSGGKRPASKWIEHVKAYSKQHGVSYKQALKDAKATYRGAGVSGGGQSGGDFWSDLGNVASTVAPFLPLLL